MSRVWKRQQQAIAEQTQQVSTVVQRPTLPPGLHEMLKNKVQLQAQLQAHARSPIIVSVDLADDWVYVVRGWSEKWTLVDDYLGHDVLYIKAHSIGEHK